MDPQLEHAGANGFEVAEMSALNPLETGINRGFASSVFELTKSILPRTFAIRGLVKDQLARPDLHQTVSFKRDTPSNPQFLGITRGSLMHTPSARGVPDFGDVISVS